MPERYDVVVVGGGAVGTAAARSLASRGRTTLLLERFRVGHDRGSSHGETRIFRLAYQHPAYVRMALAARDAWRELEDASGETLLATTGGLDLGELARPSADALAVAGAPFEWLGAAAAAERWPALRLATGVQVLHQPDGGVCYAERAVTCLARLARDAGVTAMEATPARRLAARGDRVEIDLGGQVVETDVVVVAAGAWTGPLLATAGIDAPLTPTLEQVAYRRLVDPAPLPTVIDWPARPVRVPYAVPNPEVPGSFKVGLHRSGPPVDPDAPRALDRERLAQAARWTKERFGESVSQGPSETCLYTVTPDEDFLIDRLGPIVLASPCSGHGFKFVPLIGELVADLATGAHPAVDLTPFRFGRDFTAPLLTGEGHRG